MEKSVQRIENELLCYKLLTIVESEKVGRLINKAQLFEMKISEEVENGQITNEYIIEINCRTKKIFREQMRQNSVLDQCESNLNLQEDVIEALHKCEVINYLQLFDKYDYIFSNEIYFKIEFKQRTRNTMA